MERSTDRVSRAGLAVCIALAMPADGPTQRPVISEFMARNATILADMDGAYSDWIEVYNPGPIAVDLGGWFLSDDRSHLTAWKFPPMRLAAGAHVLVFASGKDRAVAHEELHTNFRLAGAGEYLALVHPDGVTTSTAFTPAYPPQHIDRSYGLAAAGGPTTLVAHRAACTALVPTEGTPEPSWASAEPAADWLTGHTAVGYETGRGYEKLLGLDVGAAMHRKTASVFVRVPFVVNDSAAFRSLTLRMRYDAGFVAYLNGQRIASANAPDTLGWNSAATRARPDSEALRTEDFDASGQIPRLRTGANVLAFHGLNASAASSDCLLLPELIGGPGYGTTIGHLDRPTPGTYCTYQTVPGPLAESESDVQVEVPSGFHELPFTVALSAEAPRARIIYTTDGSVPTPTNGIRYEVPITIDTTSVLRAVAFASGRAASPVQTRTYIFPTKVLRQPNDPPGFPSTWDGCPAADYEMDPEIVDDPVYHGEVAAGLIEIPSLSLVMSCDDWFGPRGIWTNPRSSGRAWERQVCAELIHPDGTPGFRIDCGIRVQGGASRSPRYTPKHSMSLRFRKVYGQGQLEHALFPGSRVTTFNSLQIRHQLGNSFLHWCGGAGQGRNTGPFGSYAGGREKGSLLREQWGKHIARAMGNEDACHGMQVNVYFNGLYWGVYNLHERPDASHYAAWHGGSERDYDAMTAGRFADGNATSWKRLHEIAARGDWREIQRALAVDNLIDYLIFARYAGNTDMSPGNNWRAAGGGPDNAPWRFYHWDIDHILEAVDIPRPAPAEDPTRLLGKLIKVPEFVVRFGDRVQRHLFHDGVLTPANTAATWNLLASQIEYAIAAESARWGDYRRDVDQYSFGPYSLYTKYDHTVPHRKWLLESYFPVRTGIALQQFRKRGLYPAVEVPMFSQRGGAVPPGYELRMSAVAGTTYYTTDGTDPRLPGGAVAPTATRYTVPANIERSTTVKVRALVDGSWSALDEAVFNVAGR